MQRLIIDIARAVPNISAKELLRELEHRKCQDMIYEFTSEDTIRFVLPDGKVREAKVSGLEDRLVRAKRFLNKKLL